MLAEERDVLLLSASSIGRQKRHRPREFWFESAATINQIPEDVLQTRCT
jgi:hypothetical protein